MFWEENARAQRSGQLWGDSFERILCFTLLKGTWHTVGPRRIHTRFTGSKGHMDSSVSFPFFFFFFWVAEASPLTGFLVGLSIKMPLFGPRVDHMIHSRPIRFPLWNWSLDWNVQVDWSASLWGRQLEENLVVISCYRDLQSCSVSSLGPDTSLFILTW